MVVNVRYWMEKRSFITNGRKIVRLEFRDIRTELVLAM